MEQEIKFPNQLNCMRDVWRCYQMAEHLPRDQRSDVTCWKLQCSGSWVCNKKRRVHSPFIFLIHRSTKRLFDIRKVLCLLLCQFRVKKGDCLSNFCSERSILGNKFMGKKHSHCVLCSVLVNWELIQGWRHVQEKDIHRRRMFLVNFFQSWGHPSPPHHKRVRSSPAIRTRSWIRLLFPTTLHREWQVWTLTKLLSRNSLVWLCPGTPFAALSFRCNSYEHRGQSSFPKVQGNSTPPPIFIFGASHKMNSVTPSSGSSVWSKRTAICRKSAGWTRIFLATQSAKVAERSRCRMWEQSAAGPDSLARTKRPEFFGWFVPLLVEREALWALSTKSMCTALSCTMKTMYNIIHIWSTDLFYL